MTREQIMMATKKRPKKGDFVWDGEDEDDRPLDRREMQAGILNKRDKDTAIRSKQVVEICLSPEVTDYFRATGKDWQSRIDEILKQYVTSHSSDF